MTNYYRYLGVGFFLTGILRASANETGSIILGVGGIVLWAIADLSTKLSQIRDAIREGDGKVETVLKQRLH